MRTLTLKPFIFLSITLLFLQRLALAEPPRIDYFEPMQGGYDTEVVIHGANFYRSEYLRVMFNGVEATFTWHDGATKLTARVPASASTGPINVVTYDGRANSDDNFRVLGKAALAPSVGPPTTKVKITGTGYQPYAPIDVFFDTVDTALVLANASGGFEVTIKVPSTASPGTHWITAVQRNLMQAAQSVFTVRTDWAQFHNQNAANRYNPYENVLNALNVDELDIGGIGLVADPNSQFTSPAIAGGVAYVGSNDSKLYAFSAACGSETQTCAPLWTGTTAGAILASPAVSNRVYVGSSDGKLYAFNKSCSTPTRTCSAVWTGNTGGNINSAPAVSAGVVYVGSSNGKLYAFSETCRPNALKVCNPLWIGDTGGSNITSPVVAGGSVFVGTESWPSKLQAFKVGCGKSGASCSPLWTGTTGYSMSSSPTVAGGVVYVASDDGKLYAFKADCGSGGAVCSPLWTSTIGEPASPNSSTPAVAGGEVYVGSADSRKLYAFKVGCGSNGASCTPLWTGAIGFSSSSPAVAGGVVYVGSSDGYLYAFKAKCGRDGAVCSPLWTGLSPISGGSSPAVSDGRVYVGSQNGKLYAFDLSSSLFAARGKSPLIGVSTRPRVEDLKPDPTLKPINSH